MRLTVSREPGEVKRGGQNGPHNTYLLRRYALSQNTDFGKQEGSHSKRDGVREREEGALNTLFRVYSRQWEFRLEKRRPEAGDPPG